MLWSTNLPREGLGGIAATESFVVFGDRDFDDFHDRFVCLDANTGQQKWEVQRLAIANLDYGNSPRATPLLALNNAYCLGATGNLLCIELQTGRVIWERALRDDFPIAEELPWGYCGSPLLTDGKIIVAPGSKDASIVALDPLTGKLIWKSAGGLPSYGSLAVATVNKQSVLVGHDRRTLGAWRIQDGKRHWTVHAQSPGDFNVPTPVQHNDTMIISTRNNGTRQFQWDTSPEQQPKMLASNDRLRPDMTTPVVVGDKLYCVREFLYCLDLNDNLKELWRIRDRALSDYASLITSKDRLLVIGDGQLLLLDANGEKTIVDRMTVFPRQKVYSHPALVGSRLFIRGVSQLQCIELATDANAPD